MTKVQTILQGNAKTLLEGLGITAASEEERAKIVEALISHLDQVIIETIIVNLPEDKADEFEAALEAEPDKLYDTVIRLTAQIPYIDERLERAIDRELETIASAKQYLDKA